LRKIAEAAERRIRSKGGQLRINRREQLKKETEEQSTHRGMIRITHR
jgi:hypothetical protein